MDRRAVSYPSIARLLSRWRLHVVSGALVCIEMIAPAAAQGALPSQPIPVAVPQEFRVQAPDGAFLLAVPAGLCFFPTEVNERITKFLGGAQPALIAGECGSITALLRNGQSVVEQSTVAMMMNSDVDPATRRTEVELLDGCRAWFPAETSQRDLASGITALNQSQTLLKAEPEVSLGLLRSDAHAVYGGTIGRLAKGDDHVLQIKLLACAAPNKYPVIWLFQGIVATTYRVEQIRAEVGSLLLTAISQVDSTLRLNGSTGATPPTR